MGIDALRSHRASRRLHRPQWTSLASTHRSRWRNDPLLALGDTMLVMLGFGIALLLHHEARVPVEALAGYARFAPVAALVTIAWGLAFGLYSRIWRDAGVDEARAVAQAAIGSLATLLLLQALLPTAGVGVPVLLTGWGATLLLIGGVRFRVRLLERTEPDSPEATRVALIAPVDVARTVVAQMRRDTEHALTPVVVVTDCPDHWGRRVVDVPVHGPMEALPTIARLHAADEVVLALPSRDSTEIRRAADLARQAGLPARILPSVHDVVTSRPVLRDLRDLEIDDILGRRQVETDMIAIRELLSGRRVLITGGGGSIGAEIARQVAGFDPARTVLLDHDETHLHDAIAGLGDAAVGVLGDVRDAGLLDRLMRRERFDVVFHAAAHKHVPILERFPSEAVTTNVVGTDVVLQAAASHEVERVVLISTDKAVNPSCVMGATKRLGEQLLIQRRPPQARYCAVRFGNVLGSRGSVVPTFLRQIEQGGPVTVTHPEMTRYFMSISEAVQLVLQATVLTDGGEIFMLDMGEPVRIVELAERLILLAGQTPGRDIAVTFTGARPGEKLHEQIVSELEREEPTRHPQVRIVRSPGIPREMLLEGVASLAQRAHESDDVGVVDLLASLAGHQVPARVNGHVRPVRDTEVGA